MDENQTIDNDRILKINIEEEMKSSYIDYSMSVIVARALPDVRDGFKPVHRRILYGMLGIGNTSDKPYKKCARVVGEVLGKYHPHGDSSVYGALVRMGQDWNMRYTLVDGQGNFGSIDGDSPAAMRYTECRLSKMGEHVMDDLEKDTVDMVSNFDDSLTEPSVMPTKIPNLLVNGGNGIAVGMATNMPTHNLGEVVDGCCAFIDNPEIDTDGLMKYIPAPDFPTGAYIYGLQGVREAYETGRGRIMMRAKAEIESDENHDGEQFVRLHGQSVDGRQEHQQGKDWCSEQSYQTSCPIKLLFRLMDSLGFFALISTHFSASLYITVIISLPDYYYTKFSTLLATVFFGID